MYVNGLPLPFFSAVVVGLARDSYSVLTFAGDDLAWVPGPREVSVSATLFLRNPGVTIPKAKVSDCSVSMSRGLLRVCSELDVERGDAGARLFFGPPLPLIVDARWLKRSGAPYRGSSRSCDDLDLSSEGVK